MRTGRAGGDTTGQHNTRVTYLVAASNLPPEKMADFAFGNRLFNVNWLVAPASVKTFSGLGPTFNRVSCVACHVGGGRGGVPEKSDAMMESMLVRLSIPGIAPNGGPNPHPAYGDQLQDRSIPGVPAKGFVTVSYTEKKGHYADGISYSLRHPTYQFNQLNFGPLGDETMISPRISQAIFGLGLLEAIPEATILKLAEKGGKPNYVWDYEKKQMVLGRFGWKANQPTIRQQIAAAFLGDIGVTTPLFPEKNCSPIQIACKLAPTGPSPNLSNDFLDKIELFSRLLAVPPARNMQDSEVKQGEKLFKSTQCATCHIPQLKTGPHPFKELSYQTIEPYTDLLLHDMGPGLADGRPDFEASGSEWRTPPLWGIGLTKAVNGNVFFLHDGRARSLEEAILWHGGEAETSKDIFKKLSSRDRAALIKFLNSL
ncbi:MAG: di-heme oxidoredictase family protein [Gammaproteobacteria bacterium]